MIFSEDQLCEVFADGVRDIAAFRHWLLRKTKFALQAMDARLLDDEQMSIRPRRRWWRHWWIHVPDLQRDRETDIFMVFEFGHRERFALHVENKTDGYRFNEGQAAAYAPRARHMMNDPRFLSYSDFQTVLLTPERFRAGHEDEAALFDVFVSYEEVSAFLPPFATKKG